MNYNTKKTKVIFDLTLAGFLGKIDIFKYNEETKRREKIGTKSIESVQEKEEELFDSFDPYNLDMEPEDNEKEEAKRYLLSKGYSAEELEEFKDTLITDIQRAKNDAFNSNYQSEFLKKYLQMTQGNIKQAVDDCILIDGIDVNYKFIDKLDNPDFDKEQKFLRLEIEKQLIKDLLKKEGQEITKNYIDDFVEYFFVNLSAKEINIEYVDYYGSMGHYSDWLEYFEDYNEIETEIDNHRKEEAEKRNNFERASLELKPTFEKIEKYIDKYIDKEEPKQKIKRQIGALKGVIKNAV